MPVQNDQYETDVIFFQNELNLAANLRSKVTLKSGVHGQRASGKSLACPSPTTQNGSRLADESELRAQWGSLKDPDIAQLTNDIEKKRSSTVYPLGN